MQEAESKAKAQLKYNKCKFGIQIILLGTIAFCVLDHGILNEVKYVLDVLNLKNPERIITQVILPLKTFYDLSQIYRVGTFIFDVIIFAVIVPLFIMFVLNFFERLNIVKEKKVFNIQTNTNKTYMPTYIVLNKFICWDFLVMQMFFAWLFCVLSKT